MKCRPLITQFPLLVHLHYFLIHRMSAKGTSLDHIPPYSKYQRLLKYNSLSFCSNKLSINIRFLVLGPAGEGCVFWTKSPYSVIFERFPGTMREFFTQCFAPCAFFSWVTNHKNKNFAGATSSDTGKKKKKYFACGGKEPRACGETLPVADARCVSRCFLKRRGKE